ncbi:MAG: SufD family Fe-S cluster assembly protein, partial [Pseudomonadota bacterium]
NGEDANLAIRGVNLVGDNAHIDVTTVLEHNVPNTNAEELFRNVVAGDGHGIFQGQIKVAQIAQKTDAQMACNTLLLTDDGDFSAKPELEIFA